MSQRNHSNVHRNLNLDNSVKKSFCFCILRWMGFLIIPLTTMTEQKKNLEYIVPLPQLKWLGTIKDKIMLIFVRLFFHHSSGLRAQTIKQLTSNVKNLQLKHLLI